MKNRKWTGHLRMAFAAMLAIMLVTPAGAQTREQAKRIHDRLAGVPPSENVLQAMTSATQASHQVCADNGVTGAECAAYIAMEDPSFYNVTLKNFAAPWTNREFNVFVPLNDYIATVIGMIRDDLDFRGVLWEDIQYVGAPGTVATAPAGNNNAHYEQLEAGNHSLKDVLQRTTQSSVNGLDSGATSGVITSRAAAEAFFVAGTNRAMFRFTMVNHFCRDMEELRDERLSPDRIRQDVSRSPGGDSRLFLNNCVGCHNGMHPLAGAYAYYNYNETTGRLEYTPGAVQPKYFNNDLNFPQGFRTVDDSWENRWREGQNAYLGFDPSLPGFGNGAKSLGEELGNSQAFAACQVRKVFRAVCMRSPENAADRGMVDQLTTDFMTSLGYRMKDVFAQTAVHCMGQ